jgi:gamma-butyrobetaine dioxygenase
VQRRARTQLDTRVSEGPPWSVWPDTSSRAVHNARMRDCQERKGGKPLFSWPGCMGSAPLASGRSFHAHGPIDSTDRPGRPDDQRQRRDDLRQGDVGSCPMRFAGSAGDAGGVGPRWLGAELAARGFAVVPAGEVGLPADEAARAPWAYAERLLGQRPRMVERQPIRAVAGGRSFASTSVPCPLHTDSQQHGGGPPHAQVMVCLRQARRGGESLLLDTWALLGRLEHQAPSLFARLFDAPRRIPFVFGDVYGPTASLRAGDLVFTHSPVVPHGDSIAAELAAELAREPVVRLSVPEGGVMVVDNHRMLHGRAGFDDVERAFTRLLVWLPAPLGSNPALWQRAARFEERARHHLRGAAAGRFGLGGPRDDRAEARLALVLEMLRGAPPGVLSARYGVPEPELYRLRGRAMAAAAAALSDEALAGDDDDLARRALAELRRGNT